MTAITLTLNGVAVSAEVEEHMLLAHFLRDQMGLTGTHIGCDTSQCGCCVVHLNGRAVKSCTMFAVQANGETVATVESLTNKDGTLGPLQAAFQEHHALQCGFCTPGMLMTAAAMLKRHKNPNEDTIRHELEGNLCRCTGYHNIVKAIRAAAEG